MTQKIKVAILGSGNIGTDLMIKVMRHSDVLEMGALVGIDPESDGLARAKRLKVATTHEGLDGLRQSETRINQRQAPNLIYSKGKREKTKAIGQDLRADGLNVRLSQSNAHNSAHRRGRQ